MKHSLMDDLKTYAAATDCFADHAGMHHVFAYLPPKDSDWCKCGQTTAGQMHRDGARKWNGGVRLGAIVDWLNARDIGVQLRPAFAAPGWNDRIVRCVRPLAASDESALTWASPSVAARGPITARADLIVVPPGTEAPHVAVAVESEDPKALFAAIVDHFFADPPTVMVARNDLGPGVVLGANVILGDHVSIGPNTVIANATLGDRVSVGANCTIGLPGFGFVTDGTGRHSRFPQIGRVIIEADVEIGSNTCIDRGALGDTVIRRGAKIDNLVHVAHNCDVGEDALVIANATLCGGTVVGDRARIAPTATIREQLTIGADALVGLGAVVTKPVAPTTTVIGNPARPMAAR